MSLSLWLAFLVASTLIAISPGPGAAAAMSTGLRHGYRGAVLVIAGLESALLIQLGIVALGLGALLIASSTAFNVVKFIGAAYLIWLGIQKWRSRAVALDENLVVKASGGLFAEGLLVNLVNPKAIVFIAALTPQFIDPARPQWPQFLIIACTMCSVDWIVMSGYSLAAARLRRWLHDAAAQRAQNRFFGGVFVGAGLLLAASSHS